MDTLPPVSIVIPTLNEEKYLPRLLESLARIKAPMEVIVVDGHSSDRTVDFAKTFIPKFSGQTSLKVLNAPARGVAVQRNFGAEQASAGIIMFLDADAHLESSEQYEKLVGDFIERGYVIAAPTLEPDMPDVRARILYGIAANYARFMALFGRAIYAGTCVLVRRNTFRTIGGFNARLVSVSEDADFSDRAGKTGRFGIIPESVAVSSRRFKKYGYFHVFILWSLGSILTAFHRAHHTHRIVYPFGEFNE